MPDSSPTLYCLPAVHARQNVEDLVSDIQSLSDRLHSSKLEFLGLTAAAASFCKELSDQTHIDIEFASKGIPKDLPQEISLCLFRVLQDALQNAAAHSGSPHLQVSLKGGPTELSLSPCAIGASASTPRRP